MIIRFFLICLGLFFSICVSAEEDTPLSPWSLHGDVTLIDQGHGTFNHAIPDGQNSFSSARENSYSLVSGLNAGYDFRQGTKLITRLEMIRGIPLSGAGGLAALTNNDVQRVMFNHFTLYVAQAYVSHTVEFNENPQEPNPLTANLWDRLVGQTERFNLMVGKVDMMSLFDPNTYAHKGDDQFLNWCFMTSCAYDYAADARGYTWGLGGQLDWHDWSVRTGWFAMPRLPNQLEIDGSMGQHFGVNFEVERRWRSGAVRVLAYQGRMKLTDYANYLNQSGILIQDAPKSDAKRGGAGINIEQALSPNVGFFARAFWNGGHYETMAFTEADASFSTGLSISGALWSRELDNVGVGLVENQINSVRQRFLANGNYDLFIGDGSLLYAPERVAEVYYRYALKKGIHLTADWQYLVNPAYNQLRGPVNVYGLRFHGEF